MGQSIAVIVVQVSEMPKMFKFEPVLRRAAKIIQAQLDTLPIGLANMKRRELSRMARMAYRAALSKRSARLQ
jgi:hypothetical protein